MTSDLRILSLSSVFPNPAEPGHGLFVQARLERIAALAQVKVIAPVAALGLLLPRNGLAGVPPRRTDGSLDVFHPRWLYLPGAGFLTVLCLFAQVVRPIARLRRQFPFQVLDAHFGYPEGVVASLLSATLGIPFTVTLRGSEVVHGRYPLRRLGMVWALKRASRVIAVSETLREFAIRLGVSASRVKTIPNGVDGRIFFPRDKLGCRRQLNLGLDEPIILCAGHLIELKGHHRVIRAVRNLAERGRTVQLLIAGGPGRADSGYEQRLHRLVAELALESRVRFLGQLVPERLAEFMCAADLFCLASSREGWPNVVHEALACGTPLVATNVGAAPQLIPSEDFGIIVPPDDQAKLEAALVRALGQTWARQEIAAWARSRSWDQVAREVLDQVQEVVRETPARGGGWR